MEGFPKDLTSTFTACFSLLECLMPTSPHEEVTLGNRRFRLLKQIAEGGYSFVYLAQEVSTLGDSDASPQYAIKKVLAGSAEHLDMVLREIYIMRRLRHPNLLPLLAFDRKQLQDEEAGVTAFYLLFPLYAEGSVVELLTKHRERGESLPLRDILSIFLQVCSGVRAMHQMQPPLAHRDIKPHNVLIRSRAPAEPAVPRQRFLEASPGGPAAADCGADAESQPLQAASSHADSRERYHAVLMDFGSAREARIAVQNRQQALAQQEDAEAHCSAPYRAPELFDMPSRFNLDERVDVWSLGCLLYFLMYGVSPFERVLGETGGSLMLAVLNGDILLPSPDMHPAELHVLVRLCLTTDPGARPFVGDILARAQDLLVRCPS